MVSLQHPNMVWQFLREPDYTESISSAEHHWYLRNYQIVIEDYGALFDHPGLLPRLRGGIGKEMMKGASEQSLGNQSCLWDPPCLNDLFFGPKPQTDFGVNMFSNPYIIMSDRRNQDLVLTLRVFGLANEWLPEIRSHFLGAIRHNIPWDLLSKNIFLPKIQNLKFSSNIVSVQTPSPAPAAVILRSVTPYDCKNLDPLENPKALAKVLLERYQQIARWHGVRVEFDGSNLLEIFNTLDFNFEYSTKVTIKRKSGRQAGRKFERQGRLFDLRIMGDLGPFWPVLCAVTHMNIGPATSHGYGRFDIIYG